MKKLVMAILTASLCALFITSAALATEPPPPAPPPPQQPPAPPPPQQPPPCNDLDDDGFFAEANCGTLVDCDDNDPTKYPGAPEICNDGKDNNCDGLTDCNDAGCANDPACTGKNENYKNGYYRNHKKGQNNDDGAEE